MQTVKLLAIVSPLLLLVDLTWLTAMKAFYAHEIGEITRRQGDNLAPRWGAAILVYLIIPAGLVLFVRPRLGDDTAAWQAFGWGALFGVLMYGLYDLTNLAVLDKWTVRVTAVDMAWGGVLCGTFAVVMQVTDRWLSK